MDSSGTETLDFKEGIIEEGYEYSVCDKIREMDKESSCEICGHNEGEVARLWHEGICEVQVFRCNKCGSYRAWKTHRYEGE
jgi:hypothetical protein